MSVVILGLLASLGWGVADFGGGLSSRRAPVLGVLLWSQVASLLVGVPVLLAAGEPPMQPFDFGIAALGGALGAAGLALLYRGLAVGRMGVVAPVAAVLTATVPVIFGFAVEGVPSIFAIAGIGFAVLSVFLVSRSPAAPDGRSSGIWYGFAAGITFASFTIAASGLGDRLVVSPVVVIRIVSILAIASWIVARRAQWRVPRSLWPLLFAVGVIDMSATASYLTAISIGPLAIAAILSCLYPVVTTVLAAVLVRERISRVHAVGIVAAGVGVALIAGGTAI
jgi:drug/metabolite transporter (DMT)-like permease